MNPELNLSVCQECKKEPAVYGDGLTWSRCAACERVHREANGGVLDGEPQQAIEGEGTPHKTIEGYTSIIMPVYINNYPLFHYTGNAIGSVRSHTLKGQYELIIVDNGSPLKPPNKEAWYAEKIITREENEGVTKAWNRGIRASFGEYIVLLNNDTQVYEGWLDGLKEALDAGADLVMAHPMYSNTEPFARWVESEAVREGKKAFDPLDRDFACVMFKKDLFDRLGEGILFDERFFNYCSDSDLFKRMDEKGLKYKMVDKVAIHHMIDVTGMSIPETPEIMNKDKEAYAQKWDPKPAISNAETVNPVTSANYTERRDNMELKDFSTEQLEAEIERRKTQPEAPKLNLVRTNETGDKIFLVINNETHWVKNPETFQALGGDFAAVKTLPKEEFGVFVKGEDISLENVEKFK